MERSHSPLFTVHLPIVDVLTHDYPKTEPIQPLHMPTKVSEPKPAESDQVFEMAPMSIQEIKPEPFFTARTYTL